MFGRYDQQIKERKFDRYISERLRGKERDQGCQRESLRWNERYI